MTMQISVPAASSRASSACECVPRFNWTIAFAICLAAALVGIEAWQMWHVRD